MEEGVVKIPARSSTLVHLCREILLFEHLVFIYLSLCVPTLGRRQIDSFYDYVEYSTRRESVISEKIV